jgi:hypothetical protein
MNLLMWQMMGKHQLQAMLINVFTMQLPGLRTKVHVLLCPMKDVALETKDNDGQLSAIFIECIFTTNSIFMQSQHH